MSESPNPIYDQTTKAQGWDPLAPKPWWGGGAIVVEGTIPEGVAAQIQRGNIGGMSIRKGGKANGKGRRR